VDLFWLGHAGFRMRSGNTGLIMDPFPEDLGLRVPPQHTQAAVATLSADAPHHSAVEVVRGDKPPVVLKGPGEYEASGLQIKGVRSARAGSSQEAPLWNTMFVVQAEGITLCHLGDPARVLTEREVEELGSLHVLLLPVGNKTGLTVADAVELVNLVSPRIVVPMMFAHPGNKNELRELGPFLQELGVKEPEAQPRLSVSRSSLPDETQVVVLQPVGTML
jgi:L-ascorbate metabolism protein UlaG (beta-lactamase superfamily)